MPVTDGDHWDAAAGVLIVARESVVEARGGPRAGPLINHPMELCRKSSGRTIPIRGSH